MFVFGLYEVTNKNQEKYITFHNHHTLKKGCRIHIIYGYRML